VFWKKQVLSPLPPTERERKDVWRPSEVTGHFVLEHLQVGWGRSPHLAAAQREYAREKSEG